MTDHLLALLSETMGCIALVLMVALIAFDCQGKAIPIIVKLLLCGLASFASTPVLPWGFQIGISMIVLAVSTAAAELRVPSSRPEKA